ncbi:MAG: hypothetical protein EHM47_13280 [Ignavibacteriales bacterium]|nr:MAG: hypothetical protein EHM47_13280 [Ignavibacteriales bacterium]
MLGIVAILVIYFLINDETVKYKGSIKDLRGLKSFNPELKNLLISDILIRFAEQIPYAFVVLQLKEIEKPSPDLKSRQKKLEILLYNYFNKIIFLVSVRLPEIIL